MEGAGSFEPVYMVTNYHDGPVAGLADYRGRLVTFDFKFDDEEDCYSDCCVLSPVSEEYLRLSLERRRLFEQWWGAQGRNIAGAEVMSRWEADPDTQRINAALKACLGGSGIEEIHVKAVIRKKPGESPRQVGVGAEYEMSWGDAC